MTPFDPEAVLSGPEFTGQISVADLVRESAVDKDGTERLIRALQLTINSNHPCVHDALLALAALTGVVVAQGYGEPERQDVVVAMVDEFTATIRRQSTCYGDILHALSAKQLSIVRGMAVMRDLRVANEREKAR